MQKFKKSIVWALIGALAIGNVLSFVTSSTAVEAKVEAQAMTSAIDAAVDSYNAENHSATSAVRKTASKGSVSKSELEEIKQKALKEAPKLKKKAAKYLKKAAKLLKKGTKAAIKKAKQLKKKAAKLLKQAKSYIQDYREISEQNVVDFANGKRKF